MDWHAGRMSSRRLLVLLRHTREVGPYKTAQRGGKWPEFMQILSEIHKELALYRAAYYVGGENEYEPKGFIDPTEREQVFRDAAEAEAFIEEAQEDIYDQLGWS